MHLPWRWNESIFIAYAPGISFFKKNEEYAHGGISIQECLVPTILIENPNAAKVNAKIHQEVLDRVKPLDIAPYNGFVNPIFVPVTDAKGEIIDIKIENTQSFEEQMLYYGKKYGFLNK